MAANDSVLTLGSLFDGSGGFPLAAQQCGIKTLWASEIEPFPIRVTKKRFPNVKHLGDIRDINGAEIEPVDIITFSSPCQSLSLAGERKGLDERDRSGLFFDAVRVIREMREATDGKYPQYGIWENVLGAFSSKKGDDFHSILKELAEVGGVNVPIPRPKKWARAGTIVADDFSLSWRVLDTKHWGLPQHRERIFLIVHFGANRGGHIPSGEILYNPEDGRRSLETNEGEGPQAALASRNSVKDSFERGGRLSHSR